MDVTDNDDLMIINKNGVTIRLHVSDLRVMGRATQGVRLIKLKDTDSIASIAKVGREEEEEAGMENENETNAPDDSQELGEQSTENEA
jgi:DNA gyrase subunit A